MEMSSITATVCLVLLQISASGYSSGGNEHSTVCYASNPTTWWPGCPDPGLCPSEEEWHRLPHQDGLERRASGGEKLDYVDFVFLIEYSLRTNKTYLEYFSSAVQSLMSASHERAFKAIDMHCTVVLYSLEEADPTIVHVQDLNTITSDLNLSDVIQHSVGGYKETSEGTQYLNLEINYLAVDKALQMVAAVLDGDNLVGANGHSYSISPHLHSDLHVVVGLGLYERSKDNGHVRGQATGTGRLRKSIEQRITGIAEHIETASNVVLHFFFNRSLWPATAFIGSSRHEVRYRDCTHLNKALTLKSLLDAETEASSLQAHALALGREIHVMELSALRKRECVLALSPLFWSAFNLQPILHDKCTAVSCPGDTYCSPLHGCVERALNTVDEQSTVPDDKVPLTGEFSMSHADLAASAGSSQQSPPKSNYQAEELSILKEPQSLSPLFTLRDVVVGKLTVLKWSPDEGFTEKCVKKKRPIVLKNSVVKTWPAVVKWNFTYLAENMGRDILPLVKCTNNFLTFDPDKSAPLKLNISLPFTEVNMTTSTFFACVQEPGSCPDGLKGHYYFGSVPESLQPDLKPDRMLFHTSRDHKANKQFMWISSAGMITHAHFDQDFNFFVQLIGRKRFTLWPPSQHELMYPYPRVHPLWHKSRINYRAPDVARFPNFAKTRALQIVVGPGDVLFVPPYTWHYVETLSASVSLSTWSHDYDLYDHMNAIYKHDHKFDLIKDPRGMMFLIPEPQCHITLPYHRSFHSLSPLLSRSNVCPKALFGYDDS